METEAVELLKQRLRVLEQELDRERRRVQELRAELAIMHEVAQQTRERVPLRMGAESERIRTPGSTDSEGTSDVASGRF